jgi:hypothetical protein
MIPLAISWLALIKGQPWTAILWRGDSFILACALVSSSIADFLLQPEILGRLGPLLVFSLSIITLTGCTILFAATAANIIRTEKSLPPVYYQLGSQTVELLSFVTFIIALILSGWSIYLARESRH